MKYLVYKHGWDDSDPDASIPFDIEYGTYDTMEEAKKEYQKQVETQDEYLDRIDSIPSSRTEEDTFTQWKFPKIFFEIGIHTVE